MFGCVKQAQAVGDMVCARILVNCCHYILPVSRRTFPNELVVMSDSVRISAVPFGTAARDCGGAGAAFSEPLVNRLDGFEDSLFDSVLNMFSTDDVGASGGFAKVVDVDASMTDVRLVEGVTAEGIPV